MLGRVRTILLLAIVISGCTPARADDARGDAVAVLAKHCARCHTGARAQADFDFVTSPRRLVAAGFIVPGDAARSLIVQRIAAGEMPPETVKTRPSAAELATLRAWIDAMAAAPATAFRDDAELGRVLAADRAALARDAAPHARWLTLSHLANAGLGDGELEPYRVALAELLASLSWAPAPPAPVAIDAARTLYRIDLRELGWSAATWDAIRAAYPYGVARGAGVPDALRADWFVATASRPPLYHDILALPDTETGLGHLLGIDLAADIAAGRVARAGFTNSGVSQHNRIVERHATRHGALWRSYDFASSVGVENVFAHPLDFVPAGGELIFNLPNGLQAYMLVDAQGRRIAKAPTTIVSDPRRPDRAVENGLSCMGCHAHGIVDKADQIRDAIGDTVPIADRAEIERLHPRASQLSALYAQDRARFVAGLAAIGVTPPADPADEPITRVTARYEAELDLRTAAAELGLAADELTARLDRAGSRSSADHTRSCVSRPIASSSGVRRVLRTTSSNGRPRSRHHRHQPERWRSRHAFTVTRVSQAPQSIGRTSVSTPCASFTNTSWTASAASSGSASSTRQSRVTRARWVRCRSSKLVAVHTAVRTSGITSQRALRLQRSDIRLRGRCAMAGVPHAGCSSTALRIPNRADALRIHARAGGVARRGPGLLQAARLRGAPRRDAAGGERGRRPARQGLPSRAFREGLVGRRVAEGVRRDGEGRRRAVHLHRGDADGRRAGDEPVGHLGRADDPA